MEITRPLAPPLVWTLRCWLEAQLERLSAPQPAEADEIDLADLDARALRDIGASPRLLARAEARCEARRADRDALRLGAASAGWRHW